MVWNTHGWQKGRCPHIYIYIYIIWVCLFSIFISVFCNVTQVDYTVFTRCHFQSWQKLKPNKCEDKKIKIVTLVTRNLFRCNIYCIQFAVIYHEFRGISKIRNLKEKWKKEKEKEKEKASRKIEKKNERKLQSHEKLRE